MSTTLYRKYRPQTFGELIGQEHIKQTLQNEIIRGQIASAYLFFGARGLGKTTTARIFAKSVNCLKRKDDKADPCNKCDNCLAVNENRFLDLVEVDAASNRRIDDIRELKEYIGFTPAGADYRIFIIDEVHMLTPEAFNALLKTLEEPPKHVIFILATTEAHKLPATVISRCQRFNFRRVVFKDVIKRLNILIKLEEVKVDKCVIEHIAHLSRGYLRDAESLLGQVLSLGDKEVTVEDAALVLPRSDQPSVEALVNFLSIQDMTGAVGLIGNLVEDGIDLDYFVGEVINFLRKIMLAQFEVYEVGESLEEWVGKFSKVEILLLINILIELQVSKHLSDLPELPLEMAVLGYHIKVSESLASQKVGQNSNTEAKLGSSVKGEVKKVEGITVDDGSKSSESGIVELDLNDLSIESIKKYWREVLVTAKKHNHSLHFILKIAHPLAVRGDRVELGFEYDFHLDRLNDAKNKELARRVFEEVFGHNLKIIGSRLDKDRAKQARAERSSGFEEDKSVLDNVLKVFGGTVVE